jgi:hypothetical protein
VEHILHDRPQRVSAPYRAFRTLQPPCEPRFSRESNLEIADVVARLFKLVTKKKRKDDCRAQSSTAQGPLLVHSRTFASEFWRLTASGNYIVNSQDHISSFRRRFDGIEFHPEWVNYVKGQHVSNVAVD